MSSAPSNEYSGDFKLSAALVFAGGALGSILRLAMAEATPNTFLSLALVNLVGSLVLGIVNSHSWFAKPSRQLLWGAGFCGGFTTMSGISLLPLEQFGQNSIWPAFIGSSILGGLLFYWLGRLIGSRLSR
jgi:CrcB protein